MKKILAVLFFLPLFATGQLITTVAGNGSTTFVDNVPATSAGLYFPACARVDNRGNLFIAEMNRMRIRKVDGAGMLTTIAGAEFGAHQGDGGPATASSVCIQTPMSVAVDRAENIYIVESAMGGDFHNGPWIRKVDAAGMLTTFAGTTTVFSGDGGQATDAGFYSITDIATDAAGNVYVTDYYRVRKIDATGIVTTVAGDGTASHTGDSGPATAAGLDLLTGIAIDQHNNIYLACGYYIRRIDNGTGIITTIAGTGTSGNTGDNGAATDAQVNATKIAVDKKGNIYFTALMGNVVRVINAAGIVSTLAGTGVTGYSGDNGPAIKAQLSSTFGVSVDDASDVYVAEYGSLRVRKICMSCTPSMVHEVSKTGIEIYPNPAHSELTINAPGKGGTLSIVNATGQVIYSHAYFTGKEHVDIATLPAGNYFIKVNNLMAGSFIKE